jgi:ABC-type branched-subunit amino acid transport system ATPase component
MLSGTGAGTKSHETVAQLKEGAAGLGPLVAASNVSLILGGKPVLDGVGLAIHPSEIVTLIGPNGAGKTTLARILLGLVRPSKGSVARREGLRVGYVPQRLRIEFPTAAARPFARTPEQMAVFAVIAAVTAVFAGLYLSLKLDTAAGPSIVVALAAIFFFLAAPALTLRTR